MKALRNTIQKAVSVLLSFVMILSLFAIIPSRAAVTASTWESLADTFGYWSEITITLTADLTAGESDECITTLSGKNYTIDLNGHTISRGCTAAAVDGYVIAVKNGGELTIKDSSGVNSGIVTGGYSKSGGAIFNEGTLTIEGGTITENIALGKGGAIYNKGTLTVSGGCITNNAADDGGGVYNSGDGAVTLCGDAQITANKSADIGGGVTNFGTLGISDSASVSRNYACTEGGGIWNSGTVTMTGGSVTENSAAVSGSGICDFGVLNMKGSPVVKNNMGDDVFLAAGKTINVIGKFNAEARIGVSSSAEKAVVTGGYGQFNSENPANFFFENGEDCVTVVNSGGEVMLNTDGLAYVDRAWDAENQTVTKKILHLTNYITVSGSLNGLSKDNWYAVKGDLTINGRLDNSGTANLLLCDGVTLNIPEGIRNKQSMDSVLNIYGQPGGTGKLIAEGKYDVAAIGSDNEDKNGAINIYGGRIETTWDIGGGYKCAGGTVRVYGAKLSGGDIGCGQKSATDSSVSIGIYNSTLHNTIHNGAGVLDLYNSSVDTHGLLTFSEAEIGGHEGCTQMGDINIVNSYINADTKIGRGAVIGSCEDCDSGNIRIINSTVNAQCVNDNVYGIGYGAAIGGGKGGRGGNIVIEKSCVIAKAFTSAGIGGGEGCSGGSITITDSVVMTSTCKGGAGIGGGDDGHGGSITITNSVVHSETSSEGGAPKATKKLDSAAMSMMFEMMRLMLNGFKGNGSQVAYYHAGYIVAAFLTYLLEPTHVGAAIGRGDYVFSAPGLNLFIDSGLVVHAGSSSSDTVQYQGYGRYTAVYNSKYAKISPCEHANTEWRYFNSALHKQYCKDCDTWVGEVHNHNYDNQNVCVDCGASAVMATLTIIEKNSAGDNVISHIEAPKYTEVTLPECTNVPDGMEFICWQVEDEENYYEPGETRQVFNDTLIALYLPVVTAQFIDSEGSPGSVQARRLSDEIGFLSAGWYVADDDLDYSAYHGRTLNVSGDVRIILADGVTVLMGDEAGDSSMRAILAKNRLSTLSIYGQTDQSGVIRCEKYQFELANLNLYGGAILSNGRLYAVIDMKIVRGTLKADYFHGGKSLAVSGGNIEADRFVTNIDNQLGWTNLSDSIRFNEINTLNKGTITIAEGQALTDGNNVYTGTLTGDQVDAMQGRTLTPYQLHHFDEPEWTWSDDYHHASALFRCSDDECDYAAEVDAVVTHEDTENRIVYTATAFFNGETYTGKKIRRLNFFTGHSLSLNGDIGVNFYLDLTEEEAGDASIRFEWFDKVIGSAPIVPDPNGSGSYKASCPIAVAEMTYPITATLTVGGNTYTDTYSAVQYAAVILSDDYRDSYTETGAKRYENLATLVKTMLSYGANAQIQFDRNPDSLADAGIDYTPQEVTADMISTGASDMTANLPDGVAYKGTTIVYLSQTSIRHYYEGDLEYIPVTFNGQSVDPVPKGNEFYYELKNIAAAELDELYTLKIGDEAYQYSALDYVKACLSSDKINGNMKALAKATYLYNKAANVYFGQ